MFDAHWRQHADAINEHTYLEIDRSGVVIHDPD